MGGNQWLSENTKLTWKTESNNLEDRKRPVMTDHKLLDPKHILLTPMQIRTFVAEIAPNPI